MQWVARSDKSTFFAEWGQKCFMVHRGGMTLLLGSRCSATQGKLKTAVAECQANAVGRSERQIFILCRIA